MRLFEAVPKAVVPNIASVPKAKIPRRPRINWLNRSIALYLEFIGQDFLNLNSPASLFQVLSDTLAHECTEQHLHLACSA